MRLKPHQFPLFQSDNNKSTNKPRSFQNFCTFKTGLSDFYKTTQTVLKVSFAKQKPILTQLLLPNKALFRDQVLRKVSDSNTRISNRSETFQSNLPISFKHNCPIERRGYASQLGNLNK